MIWGILHIIIGHSVVKRILWRLFTLPVYKHRSHYCQEWHFSALWFFFWFFVISFSVCLQMFLISKLLVCLCLQIFDLIWLYSVSTTKQRQLLLPQHHQTAAKCYNFGIYFKKQLWVWLWLCLPSFTSPVLCPYLVKTFQTSNILAENETLHIKKSKSTQN